MVVRAAPSRGRTVPSIETPGDASASNTLRPIGEARSSAVATYVSNTIGSLSLASTETHANGRRDREAHSASSVVFPQPGPADTSTSRGACPSSSELMSSLRDTVGLRCEGRSSLDSSRLNGGAEDGSAVVLGAWAPDSDAESREPRPDCRGLIGKLGVCLTEPGAKGNENWRQIVRSGR